MNPIGLTLIVITTLIPAVQLFTLPDVSDKIALFSQYLGLAALILMAWGQILSTRIRGIETLFGGLDRVYVLHKWAGIVAMVAILLHDTIDAEMRGARETWVTELAETLGELSLYGLLILVVISIATFIPYHLWKWTHKIMGGMFAAGVFHFVFIMKPFAMSDPAGLYTGIFCIVGLAAYIWTLLPDTLRPARRFEVTQIETTGGALALTLTPKGKSLSVSPGQFGILSFDTAKISEPHPFSFSKIGDDGSLRVSIKALGDFTTTLGKTVKTGDTLRIQGPFGRFRHTGKRPQIWIAGGIGITPFLTWAHALDAKSPSVDLFYCVKSRDAAPHVQELEAIALSKPNLNLHIIASSDGTRLTAEHIAQTVQSDLTQSKVSFCGPVSLRKAMQSDLSALGVSPRQFHFEEFEFRTGIGLRKLATWLMNRSTSLPIPDAIKTKLTD